MLHGRALLAPGLVVLATEAIFTVVVACRHSENLQFFYGEH